MWKSCAGLNALYEYIQICQLIYLSHQHLQQFQDFRDNLPFSGKNSLFLPHQFLFSKSMYWGSGVFNAIWSKPSFRKNATLYFTPAPLRRTSYTSGLLVCFLLSTLNKFLKKIAYLGAYLSHALYTLIWTVYWLDYTIEVLLQNTILYKTI